MIETYFVTKKNLEKDEKSLRKKLKEFEEVLDQIIYSKGYVFKGGMGGGSFLVDRSLRSFEKEDSMIKINNGIIYPDGTPRMNPGGNSFLFTLMIYSGQKEKDLIKSIKEIHQKNNYLPTDSNWLEVLAMRNNDLG